jgi:hypothetical protein
MLRWRLILCFVYWSLLPDSFARAQETGSPRVEDVWRDEDSSQPRWVFAGSDSRGHLDRQRVVLGNGRDGQWSEEAVITSGNGTTLYLTRSIPPARIHPDLHLGLWVRSERVGVQLHARVVFPHHKDSQTGQPLTALVHGTTSAKTTWEQLRIDDLPRLVEQQARVLRLQHGKDVNLREPYLDLILINAYAGPGTYTLSWDDLRIEKLIEAESRVVPAQYLGTANGSSPAAPWPTLPAVRIQGSVLNVNNQPFFPRIIEHQGEPLAALAKLGFNTVRLSAVPTEALRQEAMRAGVWLIAPPPFAAGNDGNPTLNEPLEAAWDSVLVWSLGQHLDDRALPSVTAAAKRLRLEDTRRQRPLVCGAENELRPFSRQADILSIARWPLGTSLELRDYPQALEARSLLTRPGTPFWALVPTQPSSQVRAQWQTLTGRDWSVSAHEPDALRLQVNLAIGSGARGIEFASTSRLDGTDPATKQRALSLALMNEELALVEPWAAAGTRAGVAMSNHPQVTGVLLEYNNSRLLVISRVSPGAQQVPAHSSEAVRFIVPGVPESFEVFELTALGIDRLKTKRVTGGLALTLEHCDESALVLLTGDPAVASSLNRRLSQLSGKAAEWRCQLAAQQFELMQQVQQELPILARDDAKTNAPLAAARQSLDEAERQLQGGNRAKAHQLAVKSLASLGIARRALWEHAARSLRSQVASPFSAHIATLPVHARWMEGLRATMPLENRLPRGDMELLEGLAQAGWRHGQSPQSGQANLIRCAIDVTRDEESAGGNCLRLQVAAPAATPQATAMLETPPLWITTPPVPARTGEWLCFRGRIKVAQPISGSVDGVMMIDSLGGEELAERIGVTRGWEEFVLYRIATSDAPVSLTIALTGYGEVLLDDLTIRALGRSPAAPTAAPTPMPQNLAQPVAPTNSTPIFAAPGNNSGTAPLATNTPPSNATPPVGWPPSPAVNNANPRYPAPNQPYNPNGIQPTAPVNSASTGYPPLR